MSTLLTIQTLTTSYEIRLTGNHILSITKYYNDSDLSRVIQLEDLPPEVKQKVLSYINSDEEEN